MVYVPPPAPVALTDLLQSFRSALQVADKLPPVLTVRAGDGQFTRHIQVPRLRMFLRYFLNQHICRRLAHLKRAFHADAALGIDRMGELAAIDHFEQAVPAVPVRRIFVWFAVSVLFSAIAIANVATALAAEPLSGGLLRAARLDRERHLRRHERPDRRGRQVRRRQRRRRGDRHQPRAVPHQRAADHLVPAQADAAQPHAHRRAEARRHRGDRTTSTRPRGSTATSGRRSTRSACPPPREIPFDLIAQATLMLLPLLLGVVARHRQPREHHRAGSDGRPRHGRSTSSRWPGCSSSSRSAGWPTCSASGAGACATPRTPTRRIASPARSSAARPPPRRVRRRLDCSGSWPRPRAAPVRGAGGVERPRVRPSGGSSASRSRSPRVTVPFMLREGEHAGQTLGKQLFRLRVVCDDHGAVEPGAARPRASCS